jgi:hypothetical protein
LPWPFLFFASSAKCGLSFAPAIDHWLGVSSLRCRFSETTSAASEPSPFHCWNLGSTPVSRQAR